MPSLATKCEPVVATDSADMSKTIVVMMEKKIRNLEKRKGKLEDYRKKQSHGQTLTDEQLSAVAKLDDVLSQIDLLQDFIKQFNAYAADVVKQQKKQQKRERFEQIENERKRILTILQIQNVLNALGEEETRKVFTEGSGGAVKLEETELNHLDELYKIINPERGAEESLVESLKPASEHMQSLLDARDKAVCGTTYRELNNLITKIQQCPFFTERPRSPETKEVKNDVDAATEDGYVHIQAEEVPHADSAEVQSALPPEVPPPAEAEETHPQPNLLAAQPAANQPKSIEKIVENVQGQFNFLQESELDRDPAHSDPAVLAVHPLPAQPFPQPIMNHSQPPTENSGYVPPPAQVADSAYQHYNMQSSASSAPHPIPMPNETPVQQSSQSVFSAQPEHNFDGGRTFESSSYKQQDKSSAPGDDMHQRGQGQMRRGGGGGYRGMRGNHSNGFGSRGGYRGGPSDRPSGGYRGDRSSGSDRPRQGSPSRNNGFSGDQRRGGRGGPRGGNNGYRGSGRGNRGGNRGGFRGGNQQHMQHQQ